MTTTLKKHGNGYRVSANKSVFGQIKKNGHMWEAEIRETKTGDLVRFAGIWKTLADAKDECDHIIERHVDFLDTFCR